MSVEGGRGSTGAVGLLEGGKNGDLRPAKDGTGEALLELLAVLLLGVKGNLIEDIEFAVRAESAWNKYQLMTAFRTYHVLL